MIRYENECVSCPPEMGCFGSACPNRNVPRIYCDKCGEEIDYDSNRWDQEKEYHICEYCEPDEDEAEEVINYAEASQPYNFTK